MNFSDFIPAFVGFSDFFLLPAVLIEYKKNPLIVSKQKIKPFKSHTIWGIILLELAPLYICIGLLNFFAPHEDGVTIIPMVVFFCILGVFFFLLGLLLLNGTMTKLKNKRTVYSPLLGTYSQKNLDSFSLINNALHSKKELYIKNLYEEIDMIADEDADEIDEEEYEEEYEDDCGDEELNDISITDGMDGHDFEYFCADLLERSGFTKVAVTPGSGDQGVDVLASKDGIKYAIQCKCYYTPLGNKPIQEVNAGKIFYNCHVGVVMTNSTFTPKAQELANATNTLLWDRCFMQEMMDKAE